MPLKSSFNAGVFHKNSSSFSGMKNILRNNQGMSNNVEMIETEETVP
jgi:hypothetical protein